MSRRAWLGVGPAVAVIGVFMLVPILIMAGYSFMEANPYGGVRPHPSLQAYVQLLFERDLDDSLVFDSAYLRIGMRSLWLAAATTVLAVLIGFPVAYYMATRPAERRGTLVFLITVPFWTNLLIRTYCWILLLRDSGLVNHVILGLGLRSTPVKLLYTDGAILLGLVYTYIPFMILPLYASLEKIDPRLVEAAHDLYAGRLEVVRRVVIPLAVPGAVAGSLLVFIPSLGAFIAPDLLGGGKHLMLGSLIQLQFASSRNWPFGAAVAVVLLAAVMLALSAYALGAARRARLARLP